jgi:hypothetical protein
MITLSLEEGFFLAQIFGGIAVVVSLIYVGFQIRQNTHATQAAAVQAYVDTMNGYVGLINSSSNLADVLHRGANGLSNLQGGEVIQFPAFLDQCFITFEAFYFEWKQGILDSRLWDTYKFIIVDLLSQSGQQEWWQLRRHWFAKEFLEHVDQLVATEKAIPMHFRSVDT